MNWKDNLDPRFRNAASSLFKRGIPRIELSNAISQFAKHIEAKADEYAKAIEGPKGVRQIGGVNPTDNGGFYESQIGKAFTPVAVSNKNTALNTTIDNNTHKTMNSAELPVENSFDQDVVKKKDSLPANKITSRLINLPKPPLRYRQKDSLTPLSNMSSPDSPKIREESKLTNGSQTEAVEKSLNKSNCVHSQNVQSNLEKKSLLRVMSKDNDENTTQYLLPLDPLEIENIEETFIPPFKRKKLDVKYGISPHQAKYFAYQIIRKYRSDCVEKVGGTVLDAKIEPKPHQIDAALFALKSTDLKGVLLADEVGLGKTIEAGIVISQYLAEFKYKILIIAPASLSQQWSQELLEKFNVPSLIVVKETLSSINQEVNSKRVLIASYDFVHRNREYFDQEWDLVVADEAHILRNFHKPRQKRAESISHIFNKSKKCILMTATPLQNSILDMFGIISAFDKNFFYSKEAFKERYKRGENTHELSELSDRISTIMKRTLRRDAQKYIRYTNRKAKTFFYKSSPSEIKLQNDIINYLNRPYLFAFSSSIPISFISLLLLRRLGSSTRAIELTLNRIADRLKSNVSNNKHCFLSDFFDSSDFTSDTKEQYENIKTQSTVNNEIGSWEEEYHCLKGMASLASSIGNSNKTDALLIALKQGFEQQKEIGAEEKVVIFTEFTDTQEYLFDLLSSNGYKDQIVLFNGDNSSNESMAILKRWVNDPKNSNLITSKKQSNIRKALIEEFRTKKKILIATEAASEGINLQFCSMLINYDLPWNPQRVEQRIGRIHRYGQQHDVLVMNISDENNYAEQHVLHLLDKKLKIFEGVFGSSDEVLGSIEDVNKLENEIVNIFKKCRTKEEIEEAFKNLDKKYFQEKSIEMAKTTTKIIDNLDPKVIDRLKNIDQKSNETMSSFNLYFISIAKSVLQNHATFYQNNYGFKLHSSPDGNIKIGDYVLKEALNKNQNQYRIHSDIGEYVLKTAESTEIYSAELTFSLAKSDLKIKNAHLLRGRSGYLFIDYLFTEDNDSPWIESDSELIISCFDGLQELSDKFANSILQLYCIDAIEKQIEYPRFMFDKLNHESMKFSDRQSAFKGTTVSEYYRIHNQRISDIEQDCNAKIFEKEKEKQGLVEYFSDPNQDHSRLVKKMRKIDLQIEEYLKDKDSQIRKLKKAENDFLQSLEYSYSSSPIRKPLMRIKWIVVE